MVLAVIFSAAAVVGAIETVYQRYYRWENTKR